MKNAYDSPNVIALMSRSLTAIGIPGAGRTSACDVSPEVNPEHCFQKANFGGRFATMAFCEMVLPLFINASSPDRSSLTPNAEIRYYQAVTGNKIGFAEATEIGRKIWNLERAILVLQGKHRDQEKFFPQMYMTGAAYF